MVSPNKVREAIKTIILRNKLNQKKFAESIGISEVMVHYVLTGKKKLSNETVHKLCEVWNVDLESLLGEEIQINFSLTKLISGIMRLRGMQIDELVERSGIDIDTLVDIKRGKIEPTKEELKSLCNALGINYGMIDEKRIVMILQGMIEHMKMLYLTDESIDKVLRVIEEELKKREYF